MELNTDLTIANRFTFGTGEPSTLTGSGNLTVPAGATMEWGDGRMGGGGTLTVGGTLTSVVARYLDGDFPTQSSQATLNGRDLVVSGSVVWDDAPLYLNAGATVDVQSGGTFDFQRDGRIEPGDGSTSEEQVINAGTLVKSGVGQRIDSENPFPGPGDGDATTYDTVSYGMPIAVPVTNSGTLSLEAGRTAFTDALDNTGRIQGTDTLDVSTVGAFTNTGTLAPGTSPGTLTVEGPVDLSGTTLAIEALGATPGTGHDQLKATGAVQLGGTLDVTLLDGYDPPGGTSFTLVEAESVAGTFDAVNRPTLSGRTVDVEYQAGSVTLTVTADNTPPTASDDEAQTSEDTAVTVDVLANDSDDDGDPLSITNVTDPSNGTAELVDATVRYTPDSGYTGSDTFTYTIGDGRGGTDEATVTVTVQATTGTLAGTVFDNADEAPIAGATVDIAALDRSTTTDSEGTYTLSDLPEGTYSAEVNATGYQAATQEVTITAGQTTTADVALAVDNAPPTASDDEAQTTEGTAVIIDVLANDTDANGDALAITEVTDPTHGTAAVIDNAVRYTPSDGYTGEDAFTYIVSDGNGGADEGAVAVTVQATTGTLAGTVTDADSGSPLADASVVIAALDRSTTTGAEGAYTLGGLPDGTYSAEARAPGYQAGTQEVTITAGQATTADFALDPEVTNTPPTAADDAVTTFRGVPVAINVLANDTDADGDPLTIAEVGTPTLGTVSIADAGLQYVPNDGATGTDTFRYVVRDGNGGQAEGTVTVTITAQGFAVTNVGTLGGATSKAVAVDGRGRIVGVSTTERGTARAFVWDDGAIQPLPTPEGDAIQVTAVNEAGEVVGAALRDSTSEAFLITAAGASTALGTLGGPFSAAYDINRTGDVVGTAATASQAHHAFRWAGTMNDLGTFGAAHSEAFGINDAGTVVGTATDEDGTTRPFVGTTVLPDAESGRAYAINESEQMVGSQLDGDRVVARTWTSDGTGTTLEGLGGTFAEAYAINDAGWVVGTAAVGAEAAATAKASTAARFRQWRTDPGASWRRGATVGAASSAKLAGDDGSYHAVLWIDGEPRDLNDLILDPGNDWTLIEARHVSDEGQIVGYGRYRGALRAFVLRPTDNAPPQVRNDEHRVTERAPTVLDVLANDIDHDGQPLRITEVLDRPSGTVHLTGDSTAIRYAPAPGFRGSDRFRYRVSDGAGGTAHATVRIDVAVASPARLRLHPNYPNPFRTRTVIRYELPEAAPAQLALYDMLGRRVLMLVDEQQPAGIHEVTMDARTLTSGVYLLRLQAADAVETRRLTIVR
jgi:probable HAF family extracellular repeat protein